MSTSASKKIVLSTNDWNPSQIKYMKPKISDRGAKTISIISTQTNRMLHISTPMLMTWGISDYTDEMGKSDGKYTISLNYPNEEYKTADTDLFLQKMKDFENQVLDDAVLHSEEWWGEAVSRDVCKHTLFPTLKYSKNKDTKKIDYSRPPTFRAKVPCYDGSWKVEIYDVQSQLLFPNEEDPSLTPIDFVPKLSYVACLLQCTGIWIGGKGWGVTWKLYQCVVKPRENYTIQGCCIDIPTELRNSSSSSSKTIAPMAAAAHVEIDEEKERLKKEPVFPSLQKSSTITSFLQKSVTSSVTETADTDDEEEETSAAAVPEPVINNVNKPVPTIEVSPPSIAKDEEDNEQKESCVTQQQEEIITAPKKVVTKKVVKKIK